MVYSKIEIDMEEIEKIGVQCQQLYSYAQSIIKSCDADYEKLTDCQQELEKKENIIEQIRGFIEER